MQDGGTMARREPRPELEEPAVLRVGTGEMQSVKCRIPDLTDLRFDGWISSSSSRRWPISSIDIAIVEGCSS